jgi:exonuclease VII large subunit
MERRVNETIVFMKARLENLKGKVVSLDPKRILERGYSITFDTETKRIIKESQTVDKGSRIETLLFQGRLYSRVEEKE